VTVVLLAVIKVRPRLAAGRSLPRRHVNLAELIHSIDLLRNLHKLPDAYRLCAGMAASLCLLG
jgi:hypothetical protein